MYKISVALCTYNGADFLNQQLESYLAQTLLPDELIVGDDGSSDETASLINDFARRAPFPVALEINEKNLGSTENFAHTISRCCGDIIFLSDQDDVWLPEKIEKMTAEFVRAPNVGMVFSDAELVGENLAPLGFKLSDLTCTPAVRRFAEQTSFFESLLQNNFVTGATMAFRARYAERFAPFPTSISYMIHDAWIALVIAANADIHFVDECLIKYRQHARQQLGISIENKAANDAASDAINETGDGCLTRDERYARDIRIARMMIPRLAEIVREIDARPSLMFERKGITLAAAARRELRRLERRALHHETRKNLPSARIKRLKPILRELLSGRYHEISKGFLSAAKDFWSDF